MAEPGGVVTTGDLSDVIYTQIISDSIIQELRPHYVMRGFFRQAPTGIASMTYRFPLWDETTDLFDPGNIMDPIYAVDSRWGNAVDPTEGAEIDSYDLAVTYAEVTAEVKAIMSTVSTLAETISLLDIWNEVRGVMSRTFQEKWESDAIAETNTGLTYNTTVTGVLTTDDFLTAIAALEQRDITSSLASVIHLKQQADLREDLLAKTSAYWSNDNTSYGGHVDYQPNGYVGSLFSVPIYQTSLVPEANNDKQGVIFAPGEAYGSLSLWDVRSEVQRDSSRLLTEIVLSACYGFCKIDQRRIQGLQSDK